MVVDDDRFRPFFDGLGRADKIQGDLGGRIGLEADRRAIPLPVGQVERSPWNQAVATDGGYDAVVIAFHEPEASHGSVLVDRFTASTLVPTPILTRPPYN